MLRDSRSTVPFCSMAQLRAQNKLMDIESPSTTIVRFAISSRARVAFHERAWPEWSQPPKLHRRGVPGGCLSGLARYLVDGPPHACFHSRTETSSAIPEQSYSCGRSTAGRHVPHTTGGALRSSSILFCGLACRSTLLAATSPTDRAPVLYWFLPQVRNADIPNYMKLKPAVYGVRTGNRNKCRSFLLKEMNSQVQSNNANTKVVHSDLISLSLILRT